MINIVGRVDHIASSGTTVWHRASAIGKLGLAALMLVLAVLTPSFQLLLVLHVIGWVLVLTTRLPLRVVLTMLAYPATFTALFVLATWGEGADASVRLLLRPLTACLAAIWLVATTPYPDLFAPVSRILPRNAADGLFITYRALFELMGRTERLLSALRLRGGGSGSLRRRLTTAGEGVGTLVLYSFERSERLYATMLLRGHSGRICGCRHYADVSSADAWVAGCAVLIVVAAVTTSVWS